jgi:hypothetical protein
MQGPNNRNKDDTKPYKQKKRTTDNMEPNNQHQDSLNYMKRKFRSLEHELQMTKNSPHQCKSFQQIRINFLTILIRKTEKVITDMEESRYKQKKTPPHKYSNTGKPLLPS